MDVPISPTNFVPQGMEDVGTPGPGFDTTQNVSFVDTHPGYSSTRDYTIDSMRGAPLLQDSELTDFFARPVKIRSYTWEIGLDLNESFNPWTLFMQNPRIVNRISNYHLMHMTLKLKFVINGNAFHYGRLISSYLPLAPLDELETVSGAKRDIVLASQRPHLYLDPTNSQGGELTLPFFWHKNLLSITLGDWNTLGTVRLATLQNLKHANGATDSVTVSIFAWAEDVKYSIPTQVNASGLSPQAKDVGEYSHDGVISKPATVVSRWAGALSNVPVIGPFARATEMGSSAIASIAALFGYCRPVMLPSSQYRPFPKSQLAIVDSLDDTTKLSVDAKQELTIDPRTTGLGSSDELVISNLAKKESYVNNFTWAVSSSVETRLFNVVVDPCIHRQGGGRLYFPATCFAATPFKYWRGSMIFRFQVVSSRYHKGRLKIVWDPVFSSPTSEYNTAYTTIIDISDTTDFTYKVGWGQATTYRESIRPGITASGAMFDTTSYSADADAYGNGVLSVYVVNELTVPDSTINNDIEVNVFVSAGDDFEVAVPDQSVMSKLRLQDSSVPPSPAPVALERMVPNAKDMDAATNPGIAPMEDKMDSVPENPELVETKGAVIPTSDPSTLVHFGESISSFRQLLKRYYIHEVIPIIPQGAGSHISQVTQVRRNMFPYFPGYTDSTPSPGFVYDLLLGPYSYGYTTLLSYLKVAFAGWRGGTRYAIDFSTSAQNDTSRCTVSRSAIGDFSPRNSYVPITNLAASLGLSSLLNVLQVDNGANGQALMTSTVNDVISFEVPFYSNYRFVPSRTRSLFDDADTNEPGFELNLLGTVDTTVDESEQFCVSHVAAAEDMNFFYYVAPPPFYYESSAPSA